MEEFFKLFDQVLGTAAAALLMAFGLFLTVRSHFFPFRILKNLPALFRSGRSSNKNENRVSSFQAFATSLAGTIGIGNIAGVSGAILVGGPGAVFWMWTAAALCMIIKYFEIVLAIQFRTPGETKYSFGPMNYIRAGTDTRVCAGIFALLGVFGALCMGNMAQGSCVAAVAAFTWDLPPAAVGVLLAGGVALFVFKGIHRIAKALEKLTPFLGAVYILGGCGVILLHLPQLPESFLSIFRNAFTPTAATGGFLGATVAAAFRQGVNNGLFSNEAGIGSGGLAHGACDCKDAKQQGLWGIVEVFLDTVIISGISALMILCTGVWQRNGGVSEAVNETFGLPGTILLALLVAFFAFVSMLSWSYYGESCYVYLCGKEKTGFYRILFVTAAFLGAVLSYDKIWTWSGILNSLMLIFNLTGLWAHRKKLKDSLY